MNRNYLRGIPIATRLRRSCVKDPITECWNWSKALLASGYGQITWNGINYRAHRLAYEVFKETTIGDLCVLHTCDNPKCINPDHLFLGTQAENIRDRCNKGRTRTGHALYTIKSGA
jgi:hypothetical protein